MWRRDANNGDRVLKNTTEFGVVSILPKYSISYPQDENNLSSNKWLGVADNLTMHIYTPLIVVIIFYI